jgi:uncharacterized protein DUF3105
VASRREEKERLREARLQRERQEARDQRRRLLLGYAVAGLLTAAVVAGIVIVVLAGGDDGAGGENAHISLDSGATNGVAPDERKGTPPPPVAETDLKRAAAAAGCELREGIPNEANPPTSGPHIDPPLMQADGAYSEMPAPIAFVHSLEHGRIEIQYSPDLTAEEQLELKGLYESMYGGVLLFPNGDMPYAVAATAWQNLLGCPKYQGARTFDAIRAFARKYFDRGPESTGGFLRGPTPLDPAT